MRFFSTLVVLATASIGAYAASSDDHTNAPGFKNVIKPKFPLRILLSNDDSWASSNIRSTYYALKTAGHKVLMVAPVVNQSGKGGTVVLPGVATLTSPGRDNSVAAGAPYHGAEPFDAGITYVNATPGGAVLYGLDQVAPGFKDFDGKAPQLTVSGPNEGTNLGPFLYTLSGTIGASYISTERGIPGIAFSASTNPRDYHVVDWNNPSDEGVILGTYSANLVSALTYALDQNADPLIPYGIGGNVNFGKNVADSKACPHPNWQLTRLTGGAYVDKIVIGSNGLPTYQNIVSPGLNQCYNGDCNLTGEQDAINKDNCAATVSVYSVDYDAPTSAFTKAKPQFQQTLQRLSNQKPSKRHMLSRED